MKNVFIPAGDRGIGAELLEQLRIFGITVRDVEGVADVARLTSSIGAGLFLVDAGRIVREPAFVTEIEGLKESLGSALRVIFYGDKDDFDLRLRTLRAGGEAFFQLPGDAYRLAEKIDALFNEQEAEPYRVLIIDDDPEQAAYNSELLTRAGMVTSYTTDPSRVFSLLVETKPDIMLMDMYMPLCTGPELAGIVRQNEAFASIPIIFLSVEHDFEKQISAIRQGGDEFLEKPIKPEHLVSSIGIRAERMRAIRFYMERDYLTSFLNQRTLTERLANEVLRARRSGAEISFVKIDIDKFKEVNERFGHLTGDRILRSLSRLLSERLRRTDIVGRYADEEFGVILPGADCRFAARLIDELRESFGRLSHRFEEASFSVTLSGGIASYPDFVGHTDMIEAADRALRKAKEEGRDRVVVESSRF
ncbi:MAG: diguanylate cyclase [Rectinemataceae bacterium]|jgi:diguanylate cyclase (GGDEF)-like protein